MKARDYLERDSRHRRRRRVAAWLVPLIAVLALLAVLWLFPLYRSLAPQAPAASNGPAASEETQRLADSTDAGDGPGLEERSGGADGDAAGSELEAGPRTYVINSSNDGVNTGEGPADDDAADGDTDGDGDSDGNNKGNGADSSDGTPGGSDAGGDGGAGSSGGASDGDAPGGGAAGDMGRPASGHVFASKEQGINPNLTCVAPGDRDAYVKLRDPRSGDVLLAFYVRAGDTVEACVPNVTCDFQYSLGHDWQGESLGFAQDATYKRADRLLDFSSPMTNVTYRFSVDDPNITPVDINREDFWG